MKNIFIFLVFFSVLVISGCVGETDTTTSKETEIVKITPEEWGLISESEQYCKALDYFDLTNEEAADRIGDCQKDQLPNKVWKKLQKYISVEQQQLRSEDGREEREKKRQKSLEKEQKIQDLKNRFDSQYEIDFQECVDNVCNGNNQCFQCRDFVRPYTIKKVITDEEDYEICNFVSDIATCNYIKDKTLWQLKTEMEEGTR